MTIQNANPEATYRITKPSDENTQDPLFNDKVRMAQLLEIVRPDDIVIQEQPETNANLDTAETDMSLTGSLDAILEPIPDEIVETYQKIDELTTAKYALAQKSIETLVPEVNQFKTSTVEMMKKAQLELRRQGSETHAILDADFERNMASLVQMYRHEKEQVDAKVERQFDVYEGVVAVASSRRDGQMVTAMMFTEEVNAGMAQQEDNVAQRSQTIFEINTSIEQFRSLQALLDDEDKKRKHAMANVVQSEAEQKKLMAEKREMELDLSTNVRIATLAERRRLANEFVANDTEKDSVESEKSSDNESVYGIPPLEGVPSHVQVELRRIERAAAQKFPELTLGIKVKNKELVEAEQAIENNNDIIQSSFLASTKAEMEMRRLCNVIITARTSLHWQLKEMASARYNHSIGVHKTIKDQTLIAHGKLDQLVFDELDEKLKTVYDNEIAYKTVLNAAAESAEDLQLPTGIEFIELFKPIAFEDQSPKETLAFLARIGQTQQAFDDIKTGKIESRQNQQKQLAIEVKRPRMFGKGAIAASYVRNKQIDKSDQ